MPRLSRLWNLPTDARPRTRLILEELEPRCQPSVEPITLALDGGMTGGIDLYAEPAKVSQSGRFVVFTCATNRLVPGDVNNSNDGDVFLLDRQTDTVTLVSRNASGSGGNGFSSRARISADGNFVTFTSSASDLVPNDANGKSDIFLYDRVAGTLALVSHTPSGQSGNGGCEASVLSDDGQYIAFVSGASDLVPGDDAWTDLFLFDRLTNTITKASQGVGFANYGPEVLSMSADGRFIAFPSNIGIRLYDRQTGSLTRVSDTGMVAAISGDGNYVAYQDIGFSQVYLYDRNGGAVRLISHKAGSSDPGNLQSYNPIINYDGSLVAFISNASDLASGDGNDAGDVFLYDRSTDTNRLVSRGLAGTSGNDFSLLYDMSDDGSLIVMASAASDLVSNDFNQQRDIFTVDTGTGEITLLSRNPSGDSGNGISNQGVISGNGQVVVFASQANDLVPGDSGLSTDLFLVALNQPHAILGPVQPSLRSTSVTDITIAFSALSGDPVPITGLDLSDLILTRNDGTNLLTVGQTLTTNDNITWLLGGLASLTAAEGSYQLRLKASGSGIQDGSGRLLDGDAIERWQVDLTGPAVESFGPIWPEEDGTLYSVSVQFSEPIDLATFDFDDLNLTRNGGPNLITDVVQVTPHHDPTYEFFDRTYLIRNLNSATEIAGTYVLTVLATGVEDLVGWAGVGPGSVTWSLSPPPRIRRVGPVTPMRQTPVASIDVVFSTVINPATFDQNDLVLYRENVPVSLAGATISWVEETTYRIGNLAGATAADGFYVLHVNGAGIQTPSGLPFQNSKTISWLKDATQPTVLVNQYDPGNNDPTTWSYISFRVVFSEPVVGFSSDDIILSGTAGATDIDAFNASGSDFTVTVRGMLRHGTVIVSVPAGVAQDLTGNLSEASTHIDNVVTYIGDVEPGDTWGFFRRGRWTLDTNGTGNLGDGDAVPVSFDGRSGGKPVSGDWDGDGITEIGIFRSGVWRLDLNGNGRFDLGIDAKIRYGTRRDQPVVGDWDGDSDSEIGVFRNGGFILDRNGDHVLAGDDWVSFGHEGKPVVGNWDGVVGDEIGVFSGGTWVLDLDHDGRASAADRTVSYGKLADRPVVGDWNHDGIDDLGIYRSTTGRLILDLDGDFVFDDSVRKVAARFIDAYPIVGIWHPDS